MDIMIPSYLFSAISMLLMGYNNRYLAIARIIRDFFKDKNGMDFIENFKIFHKNNLDVKYNPDNCKKQASIFSKENFENKIKEIIKQ